MRAEQRRAAGVRCRVPGARGLTLACRQPPLCLALLLLTLVTGCHILRTVANVPGQTISAVTPGKKDKGTLDPEEVQQTLMRFTGEFSAQMIAGIDLLRLGTNDVDPKETLNMKIVIVSEPCAIASGPNAVANLLDMTVFVTVTRLAIEDYWQPKIFGDSAQPILEACRSLETNIWEIAGKLLSAPQLEELRQAIAAWRQLHPVPERVMGARAVGFATEVARARKADTAAPGSVFGLLGLDPLSGLDPATREIALSRMFAERALFIAQWMPRLVRWQIELMSLNAVSMPEVQQVITNTTHLAASVDRFATIAEKLPGQIGTEREEILKTIDSQAKQLTPLVNEVRQTLAAGSQMSTSLNTTITTFDALMKRFGVGETNRSGSAGLPGTNAQPFRILDYGQTAVQLEGMARQLTELVRTFDQTIGSSNLTQLSTQAGPVIDSAQSAGKQVVDYAFWKGILFVGIALAAALIYRFLATRLSPAARDRNVSP